MSVIDLCSNGVTKSYVRKEINKAVFESGTMTPDSTQQMIDDSLEPYATKSYVDEKIKTVTYYNITNLTELPSGVTIDDIVNGNVVFYCNRGEGLTYVYSSIRPSRLNEGVYLSFPITYIRGCAVRGLNKYFTILEDGSITSSYVGIYGTEMIELAVREDIASTATYWKMLFSTVMELTNTIDLYKLNLSFSIHREYNASSGGGIVSRKSYQYTINADALKIYYMNFAFNKPYVKLTITPDGETTIEYSSTYVQ